jgi:hypothetical protein
MLAAVMQRTRASLVITLGLVFICAAGAQTPLTVRGVPDGAPFRVRATATDRELAVTLDLDAEWHAYSRDIGGGRPVALTIDDGSSFSASTALTVDDEDGDGKLEGRVRLTLPLQHEGDGYELQASLALQVCDALECLAPMTLAIQGEVAPLRVLLVVAKNEEPDDRVRTERLRAWLAERGFATEVSTYTTVDLRAADAHDVVIADSDVFPKHGVGRDVMHRFPRTTAPIVAVGFIGTELCEAHGIAMTSGYI